MLRSGVMRFVHTADNHLDMPLSSLPKDKASIRKSERLKSFSKIIDYTLANADFLIISGDLFHSADPSRSVLNFCKAELLRLGSIPVFIALGNHDYGLKSEYFPGNVHVFSDKFERIIYRDVALYGASFSSETAHFSAQIPSPDTSLKSLLVLHGDIFRDSEYNPLNKDFLLQSGYDYVALGHVHSQFRLQNIAYPGCHDGGGFDEQGKKYFIFGDISDKLKIEFIPSSSRIYESIDFNISDFDSSLSVADALSPLVSDGIYQINLTGSLKGDFSPNIDFLESQLSQKAFFVSVKDKTQLDVDISESSIFRLFSEYLSEHFDGEIARTALKYGTLALKGIKEDI